MWIFSGDLVLSDKNVNVFEVVTKKRHLKAPSRRVSNNQINQLQKGSFVAALKCIDESYLIFVDTSPTNWFSASLSDLYPQTGTKPETYLGNVVSTWHLEKNHR